MARFFIYVIIIHHPIDAFLPLFFPIRVLSFSGYLPWMAAALKPLKSVCDFNSLLSRQPKLLDLFVVDDGQVADSGEVISYKHANNHCFDYEITGQSSAEVVDPGDLSVESLEGNDWLKDFPVSICLRIPFHSIVSAFFTSLELASIAVSPPVPLTRSLQLSSDQSVQPSLATTTISLDAFVDDLMEVLPSIANKNEFDNIDKQTTEVKDEIDGESTVGPVDALINTVEKPTLLAKAKLKSSSAKTWAHMVDATRPIPDEEFQYYVPELARPFSFQLDLFQKYAVMYLEKGESVFVAA